MLRRHRPTRLAAIAAASLLAAACANTHPPSGSSAIAQGSGSSPSSGASAPVTGPGTGTSGAPNAGGTVAANGGGSAPGGGTAGPSSTGQSSGPQPTQPTTKVAGKTTQVGSREGVSANTITISVSGPFSGAYAALFNGIYNNSVKVWQDEVNSQGGIFGRKIKLVKVDNQETADGAVS